MLIINTFYCVYINGSGVRCWWLTPVILATQEDHGSKPTRGNSLRDPILKKYKIGLAEWLKW
jgi:hypothetical protein